MGSFKKSAFTTKSSCLCIESHTTLYEEEEEEEEYISGTDDDEQQQQRHHHQRWSPCQRDDDDDDSSSDEQERGVGGANQARDAKRRRGWENRENDPFGRGESAGIVLDETV